MVASSATKEPESGVFHKADVDSSTYLLRQDEEMFVDGRSFSGNERDKLWWNRGDTNFVDLSIYSGCDSPNDGRAVIAADFDDDGDVDLFVHEIQRERHKLYRNDLGTRDGSFVKVRLRATSRHPDAIGATVRVRGPRGVVAQVLSAGAGFESCQPLELVFGLGRAETGTIEVFWPGGARESFGAVPAGSRVLLVEGSGKPEPFAAHTVHFPEPLPPGLRVGVGARIGVLKLEDAEGHAKLFDPAQAAGSGKLYLNLWASTCASCIGEIGALEKLQAGKEVRIAAISLDARARSGDAERSLRARGATYPSWYAGDTRDEIVKILDLDRLPLPTTLVLSPEGTILEVIQGALR